ncbi:MAG: winged helix-turn-helix domain-containing protein [Erysipelotrichaceae bacterium]|nr:winged helix-turn-helix domain-containing protein [Erysipelotrichaceae bacterium]
MDSASKKIIYVQTFGQFVIRIDDYVFDVDSVRSTKICKILAYLLYNHDHAVPHHELIDQFLSDDIDNPYATIKNLVYRMRNILKEYFPDDEIISTSSGSYYISGDYEVRLDANDFEAITRQLRTFNDGPQKTDLYRQLVEIYKGSFLPKQSSEMWIIPLSSYFHTQFISCLKSYIYVLEEQEDYTEMNKMCAYGLQLDYLDEELYYLNITSLVHQGKDVQALSQYHQAVNIIYNELGDRPSDAMNELYRELNKSKQTHIKTINEIQEELMELSVNKGAYLCEYGVFKEIYHVFSKWCSRYGMSIYMAELTVTPKNLKTPEKIDELRSEAMERLKQSMKSNLRQGDIITAFSNSQLLVLLPTCTQETSRMVMERILLKYHTLGKVKNIDVSFTVASVGLNKPTIWKGRN